MCRHCIYYPIRIRVLQAEMKVCFQECKREREKKGKRIFFILKSILIHQTLSVQLTRHRGRDSSKRVKLCSTFQLPSVITPSRKVLKKGKPSKPLSKLKEKSQQKE